MSDFRFVISVDVEDQKDLAEAYRTLHDAMSSLVHAPGSKIDWESTDEAFDDGDLIPEETVVAVRMQAFKEREQRKRE